MKAVLQLTDLHIFEDESRTMLPIDTKKTFSQVLNGALDSGDSWDLIVLSGDLADLGEEKSYEWLATQIRDLPVDTIAMPGNHDDRDLMARYFDCRKTGELGTWKLCFLDSCIPPATTGQIAEQEIQLLVESLSAHELNPHVAFLHHPPVLLGSPWMDGMGLTNADDLWRAIVAKPNLVSLVSGHAHQNFDTFRDGVRVLVTPSTCTQFVPGTDRFALDPKPPGYRRLELGEDGNLITRVKRVELDQAL
ncbi:MAG: metallophosphoesterase [Pseudomonadota bacterium]